MNTAPRTRPEAKQYKVKLIAIVVSLLVLVGLIWGTAVITMKATSNDGSNTPAPQQNTQVEFGPSGKSVEQDRKDVLAAATKLITEAGISPTGVAADQRLVRLDNDEHELVSDNLKKAVRFAPETPKSFQSTTYQTLITINTILTANGTKKIAPVDPSKAADEIFMDSGVGMAFVPLSVFAGKGAAFNLQMVYVDKEWKLSPYALVEAVKLSAMAQEAGSSTASPTK